MEAFTDHVPASTNFNVGYFLGKQSSKYWLVNRVNVYLYVYEEKGHFIMVRFKIWEHY